MSTVNPNITILDDTPTMAPVESRSVGTSLDVELFNRAKRIPDFPVRDSIQAGTGQVHQSLRSLLNLDVSSGTKELWNSTCLYKFGPDTASFKVKQIGGLRDFKQTALATQATLALEEDFPIFFLRTETSQDYQNKRARDGSTNSDEYGSHLRKKIIEHLRETVRIASEEVFVDGMESALSRDISILIQNYGDIAVVAIEHLLGLYYDHTEIAGEALRQLGHIEDIQTHHSRLTALVAHLESSDPRIRDAASLGLAALDDPAAIDAVKVALSREKSIQLRINLKLVLDQLQSTQWQVS